jgi:hypothetical protein
VQKLENRIAFLSQRDRVSRNSLNTIARSVGLSGSGRSLDTIIAAIDDLSRQAGALKARIEVLEREVQAAKSEPARDLALAALGRALKAIDAGDFDLANSEFRTVENLRWSQTGIGLKSWSEAVDARMNLALLRYRFDEARDIAIGKGQYAERMQQSLDDIQWNAYASAGYSQILKASATGDIRALYEADRIFDVELGRLLRRNSTEERVYLRNFLRAEAKSGIAHRNGSIPMYNEANDMAKRAVDYAVKSKCSQCFAQVYSLLLSNVSSMIFVTKDTKYVDIISPYLASADAMLDSLSHQEMVGMHYSYASLFSMIGEIRRDRAAFDKAESYSLRGAREAASVSDDWSRGALLLARFQLGDIYRRRGESTNDRVYLLRARDTFTSLLLEYRRDGKWREVARTQKRLGAIYYGLAIDDKDCPSLRASIAAVEDAMKHMSQTDDPYEYSGLPIMRDRNFKLLPTICRGS